MSIKRPKKEIETTMLDDDFESYLKPIEKHNESISDKTLEKEWKNEYIKLQHNEEWTTDYYSFE